MTGTSLVGLRRLRALHCDNRSELDRGRANAKHGHMHELAARDFLPEQSPLGAQEIHLWFFARWPATRDAAQSPPLRRLLAGYQGCDTDQLRIERDAHGKPYLFHPPESDVKTRLEFNLSHSGGALLVAVSRGQALGVDLETPRRSRPMLELARRYFDPSEATALAGLPEDRRETAFLHLWSCKEAVLKALGQGIAFGLDRVIFDLDRAGNVLGLQKLDGEPTPALWNIVRLQPAAAFSGALAWRGPVRLIRACGGSPPIP
jgi:4'-phosphopantetheinyl transferase